MILDGGLYESNIAFARTFSRFREREINTAMTVQVGRIRLNWWSQQAPALTEEEVSNLAFLFIKTFGEILLLLIIVLYFTLSIKFNS